MQYATVTKSINKLRKRIKPAKNVREKQTKREITYSKTRSKQEGVGGAAVRAVEGKMRQRTRRGSDRELGELVVVGEMEPTTMEARRQTTRR